jgi:prepilin-type N-terminal cleavage/methylation domain-containing protein
MVRIGIRIKSQGFTLIESLIALIILGIVMAGSTAFYGYANMQYYRGLHAQMATWIADSRMEQIKALGCTAVDTSSDPDNGTGTGKTVSLTGNSSDTSHLTGSRTVIWWNSAHTSSSTTKTCLSPLTDVAVQVSWRETGDSSNTAPVTVETFIGS